MTPPPRVVFVNRYFHPDHSATSQMGSDLAFHLAASGYEVSVITSRQRYDDARARLPHTDTANGVRIRRIWSTRFGRAGLAGRAIDYATFYVSAFLAMRRERDAIVIAMTDPPLLSVVATLAAPRVVNWVQDLFPEVANALGIRTPGLLMRLRDWSLRRARRNVVLGELMAARVPNAAIIHNWADALLRPIPRSPGAPFTVAYSGNLGRAHDAATIAHAIQTMPDVRFVFTGGGARLSEVPRLPNVVMRDYAPRHLLSESLADADVHLVSLRPELEGLIVPSKFYGILAAGRPVVFIGAPDGEVARLIERDRCGAVVASGDGDGLVKAIRSVTPAMGARGRSLYESRFTPEHAFAAWENVLREIR